MPSWTRFVAETFGRFVAQYHGRGVHALVEILLLDVDVAVEVDDADPLRRALRDAAHAGKADRMVAAQHHRQRAGGEDMRDAARDLVEALLQIGRDGEHVAGVAQCHLLAQIDAELVIVRIVERRDAPDALRPEARAGTVGRAGIERDADHGGVVFADVADVLDVGRLEKRIDAGEVRQLAARESRDRLVGQAVGARAGPCRAPIAAPCATPAWTAAPPLRAPSSLAWKAGRSRDDGGAARAGAGGIPALRERRVCRLELMRSAPWAWPASGRTSSGFEKPSTGTAQSRFRSRS